MVGKFEKGKGRKEVNKMKFDSRKDNRQVTNTLIKM